MKNVLFFLFFLILGSAILIGIFIYQTGASEKKFIKIVSPVPSSLFSLKLAPEKSKKATITFSGDVMWQSRIASQPAKLSAPVLIQQGERVVTKSNGYATILFPKISVTLSPNAAISVIQTLPLNFVFNQTNGTVVYKNSSTNFLSVLSMHLLLEEKEGEMSVSVNPNLNIITVSAMNGSVETAFNDLQLHSNTLEIKQGKSYVFNNDTRIGKLYSAL